MALYLSLPMFLWLKDHWNLENVLRNSKLLLIFFFVNLLKKPQPFLSGNDEFNFPFCFQFMLLAREYGKVIHTVNSSFSICFIRKKVNHLAVHIIKWKQHHQNNDLLISVHLIDFKNPVSYCDWSKSVSYTIY